MAGTVGGSDASTAPPSTAPNVNWFQVLAHHAGHSPDQPFASCDGETTTYAEMAGRAIGISAGLAARGIRRGDVVALLSYNSVEFLTTMFAVSHLGAVLMPLNWRLAAAELEFILDHSQARALVCGEELLALGGEALPPESDLLRVAIATEESEATDCWVRFADLELPDRPDCAPTAADDLERLMYTSGTTGRPKGVMISHGNLAWKNYAHVAEFGFTRADIGLACGPLYHVGALDLVTTTLVSVGAPIVVHRTFDAAKVVEDIERSRISVVWLAPAMLRAVLDQPGIEERDLSSVRVIIGGGEKMPLPVIDRAQQIFPGAWLADAYGLTETVSGDTFLDQASIRTKRGSVGRTCLYLELEIWDENGAPVPPGETGEIVLRGPKVFSGYWRDPEATARAFAGGWFHTGDIGRSDEDGYVFIVDRLKDMIVSGGENIASSEIERVLYEHDSVLEAAVVGRPDERWGEVPVAFVVAKPGVTPEELVAHCRGSLAKFKVPKAVVFIDELPRNPSGKVLKRELRDRIPPADG